MKRTVALQGFSLSKNIAFTSLFAALCAVGTLVIVIPLPYGYFNAGDIFVLLSAWCLGPLYGPIAAGVGSALADLWSGYALYAPATFFIKGLDALTAYFVWYGLKKLISKNSLDAVPRLLSALLGEAVMVVGYFLFESLLYGFAGGALALVGNTLQGITCTAFALLLIALLYPIKSVQKLFPKLNAK